MCNCINKLQNEYFKEAPAGMMIFIPQEDNRILIPMKKINMRSGGKIDISNRIVYAPADTAKYCPFCGEKYEENVK